MNYKNFEIIKQETQLMIYLASPYSHPESTVRESRFNEVCSKAAELIKDGYIVFCPIAMSHPIANLDRSLSTDFESWKDLDRYFLNMSDEVWVYQIPGWDASKGVKWEIEYAQKNRKVVRYLSYKEKKLKLNSSNISTKGNYVSINMITDYYNKYPELFDFLLVFEFGATKYERDNWLRPNGIKSGWKDRHDSAFHHLARSFDNEYHAEALARKDSESGLDHTCHGMASLGLIYTRLRRGLYRS